MNQRTGRVGALTLLMVVVVQLSDGTGIGLIGGKLWLFCCERAWGPHKCKGSFIWLQTRTRPWAAVSWSMWNRKAGQVTGTQISWAISAEFSGIGTTAGRDPRSVLLAKAKESRGLERLIDALAMLLSDCCCCWCGGGWCMKEGDRTENWNWTWRVWREHHITWQDGRIWHEFRFATVSYLCWRG